MKKEDSASRRNGRKFAGVWGNVPVQGRKSQPGLEMVLPTTAIHLSSTERMQHQVYRFERERIEVWRENDEQRARSPLRRIARSLKRGQRNMT
jgi:hypothetical protein